MICSSCGGKEIYLMVDDFSYEENGLFAFDMEARLEADIPEYPKHVSEYVKDKKIDELIICWICSDCEDQTYTNIDAEEHLKNLL